LNKKWLLSLILVVSVSLLAACGGDDNNEESETQKEETTGDNAEGDNAEGDNAEGGNAAGGEGKQELEPELEGIPDVVAEVNGEEISKKEFVSTYEGQLQQAAMQSQMSGQEVDQDQLKKQIAEGMIGQKLLIQEADNRGFDATEEEINETMNELVEQNGLESKEEFMAALEQQGMNKEEVMSQVETQIKVNQLISDEYGDMEPTEEELKEAYEQMKAQQEQMGQEGKDSEMPAFDEVKSKIEAQVKSQKESEASQKLVQKLREEADVTINL